MYEDLDDVTREALERKAEGYECQRCGYEPTQRELDQGSCPGCARDRYERRAGRQPPNTRRTLDDGLLMERALDIGWTCERAPGAWLWRRFPGALVMFVERTGPEPEISNLVRICMSADVEASR